MDRLRNLASGSALMLLAVVLGMASAAAAFVWIDSQESDATAEASALLSDAQTEAVVMAREPIAAGTEITSGMLEVKDVHPSAVLMGAVRDIDEVVGRVARYPLVAGEQILPSRIVGEDSPTGIGLAFAVPAGMRGVSVPVTEVSGAGGLIVPGDRVDVLVSTEYGNLFGPFELQRGDSAVDDPSDHPTVVTVLQDVLVLAVGQVTTRPLDEERDPATLRTESAEAQPEARSVTLAVAPTEAQSLFLAAQRGTLGLALRSFGDTDSTALNPLFKLESADGAATGLTANR